MPVAKAFFSMILKITIGFSLVICSLIYAFRWQLARLLTNDSNDEVVEMSASVLKLVAAVLVIDNV